MGFKLIAIRPLENCGEKFLKNLDVNRIYKFYDNFEYYSNNERIDSIIKIDKYKKVEKIIELNKLPEIFFTLKNQDNPIILLFRIL